MKKYCLFCGKEILRIDGKSNSKYCSNICYFNLLRGRRKYLNLKCIECGKDFKRVYSKRGRVQKFCSKQCHWNNYFKSDRYKEVLKKRRENKKPRKVIALAYYYRNTEKAKEYYHRKSKGSIGRIYSTLKQRNRETVFNIDEFESWYKNQPRFCAYCGITEENWLLLNPQRRTKRLTIDRKDNNIGYLFENMTLACDTCNKIKNDILSFDEMKEIAQKYIKPKWQNKLKKESMNEVLLG